MKRRAIITAGGDSGRLFSVEGVGPKPKPHNFPELDFSADLQ
jgi:hypothetical protein